MTVSTSLCKLYELLFIKEFEEKSYTPPHQFGFQHGIGWTDALTFVAKALLVASSTGSSPALASHDVCLTFDSLLHPLMLLRALKGGNLAITRSLRDIYAKL